MRQAPSAVHMPTTRPVLCVIRLYPFSAEVSRYIYLVIHSKMCQTTFGYEYIVFKPPGGYSESKNSIRSADLIKVYA